MKKVLFIAAIASVLTVTVSSTPFGVFIAKPQAGPGQATRVTSKPLRYSLTDLGAFFTPTEINNKGQIIGSSFSKSLFYPNAALYDDGTLYDLGNLGGFLPASSLSVPYSLNEQGQIVGYSTTAPNGFFHAFLWEDGVMTDLTPISEYPSLANGRGTTATDINNRGQIVGFGFIDGVVSGAFLWDNGEIIPLGTLGGTLSAASRINNSGQIAGDSGLAGDVSYHAFLYDHGTMMDLGTFGGSFSQAKGLNNRGEVVGYATTAGGNPHAFLFTKGTMIDLGLLIPTGSSYALDINNRGQVIVEHTDLNHSFLYDNGTMTDVTELVYTQLGRTAFFATGINDAGCIVGYAYSNSGFYGVLLSPVP